MMATRVPAYVQLSLGQGAALRARHFSHLHPAEAPFPQGEHAEQPHASAGPFLIQ